MAAQRKKKNNKAELLTQYTKSLETGSVRIIDGDGELSVKLLFIYYDLTAGLISVKCWLGN